MTDTQRERASLIRRMMGVADVRSVPRLWCPPITHYTDRGTIDVDRMAAHWRTMTPYVGGFLVPGSTGEAWEMTSDEVSALVETAIELATQLHTRLLVGVLRTDVEAMHAVIDETMTALKASTGETDPLVAMKKRNVAGFTICPPRGADLGQAQIGAGLESILDLGLPVALYQLPQITQNEVAPETFSELASHYPNLLLFKDTSGHDRVPVIDRGASGVFLVRGAEGDYAQWLEEGGGCYRGLLLSTANGFARELHRVIALLEKGDLTAASALSRQITQVVNATFEAVATVQQANAFANANKAIDHFRAYGRAAVEVQPPMLHAGVRLPAHVIREVGSILEEGGLMPSDGYLTS
jgi:dihydrodipicolinate synthase/N-acetylneuraminate lyase